MMEVESFAFRFGFIKAVIESGKWEWFKREGVSLERVDPFILDVLLRGFKECIPPPRGYRVSPTLFMPTDQ